MKIISACFVFLLVFLVSTASVRAQRGFDSPNVSGGEIDKALLKTVPTRFLPSNPLYFSISFKETIARFFKPSSAERAQFDFVLSGKRLKESYLLQDTGDEKEADKNLIRYQNRISKTIAQINKARSQNQDLGKITAQISDDLEYHQILLLAIKGKDNSIFSNLDGAINSFLELVITVDKLKPGVKDRFKDLTDKRQNSQDIEQTPSPSLNPFVFESSPSASPRRIIY